MESEEIYDNLRKLVPQDNIKLKEPMSKHISFKTGGPADFYIKAKNIEEIENIISFAKEKNIPIYVMGNGSNLLVLDKGIRGMVLKIELESIKFKKLNNLATLNANNQPKVIASNKAQCTSDNEVQVTVGAGVKIMALAQMLKQKGISGFEELAGVPGTIGGANYMNAGAYGKEIKDIIIKTKALNVETGYIETLEKSEQQLSYRNSIFKNKKYIILETTLSLQKGNLEEIQRKMQEYMKQRKEKQPTEYPSAGSTFKRGENFITAKLIDECGLRGYSIGGAEISEKHAGFIINKGDATSKDILDLIQYTKKKVFEKFGVNIQEEVEIIGEA